MADPVFSTPGYSDQDRIRALECVVRAMIVTGIADRALRGEDLDRLFHWAHNCAATLHPRDEPRPAVETLIAGWEKLLRDHLRGLQQRPPAAP